MSNLLVVLLGPPGSGKGTQGALLAERTWMKHVSTGDLLRANIATGSELGKKAAELQKVGAYVDDATMTAMISEVVSGQEPIILDGFPRTWPQAVALEGLIVEKKMQLLPILLEIDVDVLKRRIAGRLTHPGSGRVYNVETNPPAQPMKDDLTGEPLVRRPDDIVELFDLRFHTYRTGIEPVVEYYEKRGLVRLDADRTPEEVLGSLEEVMEKSMTPTTPAIDF